MLRHYTSDLDLSSTEYEQIIDQAIEIKKKPNDFRQALAHKTLAMVFEKSSTRTRVSFEAGILKLGGNAIFLSSRDLQLGRGEPISDTGKVLSRYIDLIMIRTFAHDTVQTLAKACHIPVINGLDDLLHPCQSLADFMTIKENFGKLKGRQLVFIGDGNNVAHSLMYAGALTGVNVHIISPAGYEPKTEIYRKAREVSRVSGAQIEISADIKNIKHADVVYTDVWASMGQEDEQAKRIDIFQKYQITPELMQQARSNAIFLHCLPAHRGEEVHSDVIDGPQSRVFDEAENRMHVQNALMLFLLEAATLNAS